MRKAQYKYPHVRGIPMLHILNTTILTCALHPRCCPILLILLGQPTCIIALIVCVGALSGLIKWVQFVAANVCPHCCTMVHLTAVGYGSALISPHLVFPKMAAFDLQ